VQALSPLERWIGTRTFHRADFPAERVAVERDATISVCVVGDAGEAGAALAVLLEGGAVDEVVVVGDGAAAAPGARAVPVSALLPELGPVLGRGDAMWRALSVVTGDVVAYVDPEAGDRAGEVACGLVGPIVCEPGARFAAGVGRPGGTAGRRALLERLPFAVGEAVERGLLLGAHAEAGLRGLAQVDLGDRPPDTVVRPAMSTIRPPAA
jgi:glucosyl-3-phosphoglycerate synthase